MAFDAFLVFDTSNLQHITLVGESTDQKHPQSFELKDWSFGAENPTTIGSATGGAGAGKVKFNEFTIKKTIDNGSPQFFLLCASGQHIKSATLFIRKAGGVARKADQDYLIFTFALVFVSKISWSGSSGDESPTESVTFVFGAMRIEYHKQINGGGLGPPNITDWSQVLNQPGLGVGDQPT